MNLVISSRSDFLKLAAGLASVNATVSNGDFSIQEMGDQTGIMRQEHWMWDTSSGNSKKYSSRCEHCYVHDLHKKIPGRQEFQ